jgi:prophage maintenance system killer protein
MKYNNRQLSIIDFAKKNNFFQTKDILAIDGKDFAVDRITIIRDLSFLVSENIITSTGKGRSVKYKISTQNEIIEQLDVKKYFSIPDNQRKIKTHFDFEIFDVLKFPIFTKTEQEYLHKLHTKFVKSFAKYDSQTIVNKEFETILIEFSWKSSQIEGNTYSLLSTERLIKENIPEAGKTKEETQMILNHKDIFNEVLQHKEYFAEVTRPKIEHIHQVLTKNLSITKNIRSHPVGITGTNYRPLDNKPQIEEAFEKMVTLINLKEDFFERSFLLLLLLSYIQAFEDGNKRTARMTSNAVLLAAGSIPMSYRAVNELEYKEASLIFYEINNISYFKKIFIQQFTFAVENYFL